MHRLKTWQLFAVCVLIWGTTWHAVTYQLSAMAPEFAVALRFALAGGLVLAYGALRGQSSRLGVGDHAVLAVQGALLYGVSYVCVYQAERFVASGLVAVGYSASPLIAGIGARLLFRAPLSRRFVAGGLLGLGGIALIFWPELVRPTAGDRVSTGVALTVAAVLLSSVGALIASRNRQRGLTLLPVMGWGMLYGALAAALVGIAFGGRFALPATPSWWLSFAYLAVLASVLPFACFLTLQDRVGPGPTGTIGVMTPLLALVVSVGLEGFRPAPLTGVGMLLAIAGNVLMLRPARNRLRAA